MAHKKNEKNALPKNMLGVAGVTFFVLAAVAPLTGIVVIAPIGMALGDGAGITTAFIIATIILLLFAVGYAQMAKQLTHAGGFYAFVVRGLGRPAGLTAAFIALLGYNFFVAGAVGTLGFLFQVTISYFTGFEMHWMLWGAIAALGVFLLTRAGIDVSAKVLGVSLILEISILIVFDIAVLFSHGYDFAVFAPNTAVGSGFGLALLFCGTCFLGFEATALYGEEAREPKKTIPVSVYIAITFIGVFDAITTWAISSAIGVEQVKAQGIQHLSAGDLVFTVSQEYIGEFLTSIMMILLLVSLAAALLALHNCAVRYLYSLGRVGVLPRVLARTRTNGAPQVASAMQIIFAVAVASIFAIAHLDPLSKLTASMTGFGTLAILALQMLAALAVVVHFRRAGDKRFVKTFIAPFLGFLGLIAIVVLAISNFSTMAGSDAPAIAFLPWLLLVAVVGGPALAAYLRRRKPAVYAHLYDDLESFQEHGSDEQANVIDKYNRAATD